ncbi:P-loop containing nucleoside triphosphate hydrolase protein [Phascolomyces articulosus]|uniref:P-loop containing nucleoside triphosphate hydrolase protein n=1 Tax=Phascolomyces articulosus TaxID=60185 RepID=A0AAD5JN15_9FUNG|nr:P-loop containing nucleoside triphosphate hydrolase protein [Phascolomyces articulosus]
MFRVVIRSRSRLIVIPQRTALSTRSLHRSLIVQKSYSATAEVIHPSPILNATSTSHGGSQVQQQRQPVVQRSKKDIIEYLYKNQQRPIPTGKPNTILTNCPHCLRVRKASFAATIDLATGAYKCRTCHSKGSWHQFTKALHKKLQDGPTNYQVYDTSSLLRSNNSNTTSRFSRSLEEIENYPEHVSTELKQYWLEQYKLDPSVLELYRVGVAEYANQNAFMNENEDAAAATMECITFPQTTLTYAVGEEELGKKDEFKVETVRVKACASDQPNNTVAFDPPTANEATSAGLFGYHTIPSDADTIILTRREMDAMAAHQATGLPSVSLPTANYQLQESILPLMERFSKVYLWLDDDVDGQMAAERFAHKLGEPRCLLVNTNVEGEKDGPRTPHEAFMQDKNLQHILQTARRLKHDEIMDFHDLREEVLREVMNPEQTCGVQSKDLPQLNEILKGHRPGELTILTGPTGAGKTTIISQLSLDYCTSGVPTLWGSFEILNKRLAKKMLYQLAGKDLSKAPREFDVWADKFEQLPLYFLKFFSSTAIRDVLKACSHAVYAYDVRHIILDNLQFMLSQQGRSNLDRWELQDDAVAELRKFATEQDVHITLVVHPRKDVGDALDINSVFGSAKVTQEADNVIIIQKGESQRYLDIKKNRFDGTLGTIPYEFETDALKIRGLTEQEQQRFKQEKNSSSSYIPMYRGSSFSKTRIIPKKF